MFYYALNLKMVLKGQTWHEQSKNIDIYDLKWKNNLIEVFGSNWLMCYINPFLKSKLPGDGTKFIKYMNLLENESSKYEQMNEPFLIVNESNASIKRKNIIEIY